MKNYLVIGGSTGIGFSVVKELLAAGNTVHVIAREKRELPQSDQLLFYPSDITHSFPKIETPLSGLVYLPGTITLKPFQSLKKEDFLHDFSVNVIGAFEAISTYLPNLKSEDSSIVLISSVAASKGFPFHASIGAAKAALEGLTKSCAAEFAPKIRVNCVAPSLTQTPLTASIVSSVEKRSMLEKKHPLQKIGTPEDISGMICYLLSEKSKWVTGQVFHIDGGIGSISL